MQPAGQAHKSRCHDSFHISLFFLASLISDFLAVISTFLLSSITSWPRFCLVHSVPHPFFLAE